MHLNWKSPGFIKKNMIIIFSSQSFLFTDHTKQLEQLQAIATQAKETAAIITSTTDPMAENVTKWSKDLRNFKPERAAYERATVTTRDTGTVKGNVIETFLEMYSICFLFQGY